MRFQDVDSRDPYLNWKHHGVQESEGWGLMMRGTSLFFVKKRSSFMYKCFFRIFATTIKFLDMPIIGKCSNNLFETSLLSTRNVTDMAKL